MAFDPQSLQNILIPKSKLLPLNPPGRDPFGNDLGTTYSNLFRSFQLSRRELIRNGLFEENGSEAPGVVPLVDLWYDITNHLNQEDIPSPLELRKERDALSE